MKLLERLNRGDAELKADVLKFNGCLNLAIIKNMVIDMHPECVPRDYR